MRRSSTLALLLVVALTAAASADAGEHVSTLADQRAVGITIYNSDLALVRDRRHITLPEGESQLALRDVSAKMQSETALVQGLTGNVNVLEQNFNYDLLTPETLLSKYIGRDVNITRFNPVSGKSTTESGRVLSLSSSGAVMRFADRIATENNYSQFSFPSVPANLRDRPTLVTEINSGKSGGEDIELTYLSGGLSWRADYNAELSADDSHLDLRGLVTLQNASGTEYRNASVQLVAGDVNVVRTVARSSASALQVIGRTASAAPLQEDLLDYHLYTLRRKTTIADNQTKQVELLTAASVPVTKALELRGGSGYYRSAQADLGTKLKIGSYLSFVNLGGDLGVPLPAGAVRVYKRDNAGTAQFVGSDSIDHTPKGATVRLRLGASFDVTANKKQTDFRIIDEPKSIYESAYQIVVSNAKNTPQTVLVVEPVPGDWTMLTTSQPFTKSSSSTATWSVQVPAESSTTLTYRVRVKY